MSGVGVLLNAFNNVGDQYRINVTLKVADPEALWEAAARRALASPVGLTLADVEETLGPLEAPSISDCLAMLMTPADMAGCVVTHFEIDQDDNVADADHRGMAELAIDEARCAGSRARLMAVIGSATPFSRRLQRSRGSA